MAIYSFNAKVVSRSKGQNAVATAAYNARDKLTDERTGELKDYSRAEGLIFSGVYAPKDAPEWARDRAELWNRAEAAEKRSDSTIARNYTVALPHELTNEQRRWAVEDFIKENFTRKGYAADLSIHAPDRKGDERNYHAHILVTDRRLDENGFADNKAERKMKSDERKAELDGLRGSWERIGNRHLERHGFEPSLNHRSLKEQGIDREAQIHVGVQATALERDGIQTERGDLSRAIEARNMEHSADRVALGAIRTLGKALDGMAGSLESLFATAKPELTDEQKREQAAARDEHRQEAEAEAVQVHEKSTIAEEHERIARAIKELEKMNPAERDRERDGAERERERVRER